jgi:hypothetical protein
VADEDDVEPRLLGGGDSSPNPADWTANRGWQPHPDDPDREVMPLSEWVHYDAGRPKPTSIVASGGWTAPVDLGPMIVGTEWWQAVPLEEQDDGTFTVASTSPVMAALPLVPTERGGVRYGEPAPNRGHVAPWKDDVVHRVTLRAYGDTMNPGAGMMTLECSCGEVLLDQGDEPGDLPLAELVRLERMHTEPGWDDDDD